MVDPELVRAALFVAIVAVIGGPGCSFALVRRPPVIAMPDAPCTESRAAPIADVVLATAEVVGAGLVIAGVGSSSCMSNTPGGCAFTDLSGGLVQVTAAAGLLIAAAAQTGSAVYGFHTTHACRERHAQPPPPAPLDLR